MIEVDLEQTSPEWFALRAGVITASNFDKIATSKGEPSKQAQKYIYQLAGEAILGTKEEGYTNAAMERGIALESEAKGLFELITGHQVRTVGFCFKDEDRKIGCSPDGLIDPDAGVEIKCPILSTHIDYLIHNRLPTIYHNQIQGSMYVTNRKWWHFLSYYPGIKPLLLKIERDDTFIEKLAIELDKQVKNLNETIKKIQ